MVKRWLVSVLAVAAAGCYVAPVDFVEIPSEQPVEDCATVGDEDGNGAADCSDPVCAAEPPCQATCSDGTHNGSETDVDCGGDCAPCSVGRRCAGATDCVASAVCDQQVCRVAQSCAEILAQRPTAGDGVYTIAPTATTTPYEAVCDMTRDGGGWTLLLKSTGDAVLAHGAALWSNGALLNEGDLTTQPGDAKYPSFLSLRLATLRGELDGFVFTQAITSGLPAHQVFGGVSIVVDTFPTFNSAWSTQPNCHTFGINTPYDYVRARFGWTANQEPDCNSNDTAIGLGITGRGAGYICGATECSLGTINAGGVGLLWGR